MLLSLMTLISTMMADDHFSYLNIEECDPLSDDYLSVFKRNLKKIYTQENIISNNVKNFVESFIELFQDAVPKEQEYVNPIFTSIFTFDYPKLSALFSLCLHIFMSGGLRFTDTTPV